MTNNKKHILFDIGGVLLHIDFHKVAENLRQFSKNDVEIISEVLVGEEKNQFESGAIDERQFYQNIAQRVEAEMSYERFCDMWCDIFSENTAMSSLVHILEQTHNLIIASNTNPMHYNYIIERYPFIRNIRQKALSYEMRLLKPDPRFFLHVLKKFRLIPAETLLIDDLVSNIEAAQKIGISGIIYRDHDTLLTQLTHFGIPLNI